MSITAKSFQSCPALDNPIDGSPQGSPIPGILQARILEWVAIAFSIFNNDFIPNITEGHMYSLGLF